MSKAITLCVILFACSIALAGDVTKEWRARYDTVEKVFAVKDMKALDAMCGKDLVWIQVDGKKKNRKETMAEFAAMFQADKVSVKEKLLGLKELRGKAVVSCDVTTVLSFKGKPDMRVHSQSIDTWKKVGKTWQIIQTHDTKVETSGG